MVAQGGGGANNRPWSLSPDRGTPDGRAKGDIMRKVWLVIMLLALLLPLAGCLTQERTPPVTGAASGFGFLVDPSSDTVALTVTSGAMLQRHSTQNDARLLVPDVDLEQASFRYWFEAGNRLVIEASFRNIHDLAHYTPPFLFVPSGSNYVSSTEPTITNAELGGDAYLGPGEVTSVLRFEVIHKRVRFTYFVDAYAVVLPTTERVSVDSDGNQGNNVTYGQTISAAGRFISINSHATNLVSPDANGITKDVFRHDRLTGITELASVDSGGVQANDASNHQAINADGRYVVIDSIATNLVPNDTNAPYPSVPMAAWSHSPLFHRTWFLVIQTTPGMHSYTTAGHKWDGR